MPYHNRASDPQVARTSYRAWTVNSVGGIGPISVVEERPEFQYNSAFDIREGQNLSRSNPLVKLVKKPKIRIYNRIIGYEFVKYKKVKKKYLPNGKVVKTSALKAYFKPIKIRSISYQVATSDMIVKSKSIPLYPNPLKYTKGKHVMSPNRISYVWQMPHYVAGAYFKSNGVMSGPGQHHISPWEYVTLGSVNDVGTIQNPGADVEEIALNALYKKIGSSDPSLLTALGESPELLKTLTDILLEGAKLANAILKLRFTYLIKKVDSTLDIKKLSELWLSWVFGIKPVVKDIQDTLATLSNKEKVWRSYSRSTESYHIFQDPLADPGSISECFHGHKTIEYTDKTTYGCLLSGRLTLEKYIDTKVLDVTQLISTGYELIPLSFMLDWFIDIGGYLSSAKILSNQEYFGWRTRCRSYSESWYGYFDVADQDLYPWVSPDHFIKSEPFKLGREYFICERSTPYTFPSMPLPSLTRIDSFVDMSTVRRSINAIAIAITRYT